MIWMLLEEFQQDGPSFVRRTLYAVDPGQVQIRLIECGRNPDALFETRDCFISPLGAQIEYSEVVQGFRVSGTRLQGSLQILIGMRGIIRLRKDQS
jgi:hypothetical protein